MILKYLIKIIIIYFEYFFLLYYNSIINDMESKKYNILSLPGGAIKGGL